MKKICQKLFFILTKKLSHRGKIKAVVLLFIICLLDYVLGLIIYAGSKNIAHINNITCRNIFGQYVRAVNAYDQLTDNEKKYYLRYIPDWEHFNTVEARTQSQYWTDNDYLAPAPASINYIRKLLYQRKGKLLLFNMNNTSTEIQNDPKTIIIVEPYPLRGERMALTVYGMKHQGKYTRLSEDQVQKQFKRQKWFPEVSVIPRQNLKSFERREVDGSLPLSNIGSSLQWEKSKYPRDQVPDRNIHCKQTF